MGDVSIRDLRNHGGEVVDRAARGERVTITRSGSAVAELRALPAPPLFAETLIQRRHSLPAVDPAALRSDLDSVIDASI